MQNPCQRKRVKDDSFAVILRYGDPPFGKNSTHLVTVDRRQQSASSRDTGRDIGDKIAEFEVFEILKFVVGDFHRVLDFHGEGQLDEI